MAPSVRKKPKGSYHHGNLEKALVDAAVSTIKAQGIDALTLRGVGARLGVSRTALYRHFEDKAALLARVAREGFAGLRSALENASSTALRNGTDPLEEMAAAYVGFAVSHGPHYRTMFGREIEEWGCHPGLNAEAESAFGVLLDAIIAGQAGKQIVAGDPLRLAHIIWPLVHGIASLGLEGHLGEKAGGGGGFEDLAKFAWRCLQDGIQAR